MNTLQVLLEAYAQDNPTLRDECESLKHKIGALEEIKETARRERAKRVFERSFVNYRKMTAAELLSEAREAGVEIVEPARKADPVSAGTWMDRMWPWGKR